MAEERLGKERVAILAHSMEGGGAERVISNLSRHLSGDYSLILYILDGPPSDGTADCDMVVFDFQEIPQERNHNLPVNPIRLLQMAITLWREVRKADVSMIISFLEVPNFLNVLIPGKHQRIVSVRNHMSSKGKGLAGRKAVSLASHLADCTVAVSEMCRRDLIENFGSEPGRVTVIPNPVDLDLIGRMKQESDDDTIVHDGPMIVNVARLAEAKGHKHLIKAFREVREVLPDALLVLVGDGEERGNITRLIADEGMQDSIVLAGHRSNPYRLMASADVFVLSSFYEGLPNSILEAMACGVPVISTDCLSGPREIISPDSDPAQVANEIEHSEFGILVPPWKGDRSDADRESMLAQAILGLLTDEGMKDRYGRKGLERAMDFSVDRVIPMWDDFIKQRLRNWN